ncbi:MAG: hypothetical protein ACYCW6_28605 [Candidatus Xenobia bacterium]
MDGISSSSRSSAPAPPPPPPRSSGPSGGSAPSAPAAPRDTFTPSAGLQEANNGGLNNIASSIFPLGHKDFNYTVDRKTLGMNVRVPFAGGSGSYDRSADRFHIDSDKGSSTVTPDPNHPGKAQLRVDNEGDVHTYPNGTVSSDNNSVTWSDGNRWANFAGTGTGFQYTSHGINKDNWVVNGTWK